MSHSARSPALALPILLVACASPGHSALHSVTMPVARTDAEAREARTPAQATASDDANTLPLGVGFGLSPTTAVLGAAADFRLDDHLTVGPAMQFGVSDDDFLFAPFFQGRYWLPVDDESKFAPFVQGGIGLTVLDKSRRSADVGPLLNVGGGVRYRTGQHYTLSSSALFNFVPGKVAGESFYFTWEVIQIAFRF